MTSPVNRRDTAQRATNALVSVLPHSVKVRTMRSGPISHLAVNDVRLRIAWVGEGWLRDIRPVLAMKQNRPDVIVARRMSPGAREAAADSGIGWVDETGAAEIAVGPVLVSRTGHHEEAIQRPKNWTASVFGVAEALLCGTKATVAAVQNTTGLSTGTCTNALRFLSDLQLLAAYAERGRHSGRYVTDPDQLLDAYASEIAAAPVSPSVQAGVVWRDAAAGLARAGSSWDRESLAWACTGALAASVIAPYLTSGTAADVYVDAETLADLEAAAAGAGLRVIEGGRLTLRPFPTVTTSRLATRTGQLWVAPWPRVYADLRIVGVRGEEAAEHLRETMHGR